MTKEQLQRAKVIEERMNIYEECERKIDEYCHIASGGGDTLLFLYYEMELVEIIKNYCSDKRKVLEEELENL